MPKFFSPDWVAAVDAAIQASPEVAAAAAGKSFVFEQVATGGPEGELAYHLVVADGAVRAVPGRSEAPTVAITGPWEVHVKINKGELSPPVALLSGKGRARGDRMKLMTERTLLAAVQSSIMSAPVEYS
jgi:putative sterol carrier protein